MLRERVNPSGILKPTRRQIIFPFSFLSIYILVLFSFKLLLRWTQWRAFFAGPIQEHLSIEEKKKSEPDDKYAPGLSLSPPLEKISHGLTNSFFFPSMTNFFFLFYAAALSWARMHHAWIALNSFWLTSPGTTKKTTRWKKKPHSSPIISCSWLR